MPARGIFRDGTLPERRPMQPSVWTESLQSCFSKFSYLISLLGASINYKLAPSILQLGLLYEPIDVRLTNITCQYLDNSSFITFRQTWVLGAVSVCVCVCVCVCVFVCKRGRYIYI